MIREGEKDKNFIEQLKSPLKPINNTETSPEMQDYLDKLNTGQLKSEETIKKEEKDKKTEEEDKRYKLFCPHCRRPTLKRTPQLTYKCSFCGFETNSPLRMAESK